MPSSDNENEVLYRLLVEGDPRNKQVLQQFKKELKDPYTELTATASKAMASVREATTTVTKHLADEQKKRVTADKANWMQIVQQAADSGKKLEDLDSKLQDKIFSKRAKLAAAYGKQVVQQEKANQAAAEKAQDALDKANELHNKRELERVAKLREEKDAALKQQQADEEKARKETLKSIAAEDKARDDAAKKETNRQLRRLQEAKAAEKQAADARKEALSEIGAGLESGARAAAFFGVASADSVERAIKGFSNLLGVIEGVKGGISALSGASKLLGLGGLGGGIGKAGFIAGGIALGGKAIHETLTGNTGEGSLTNWVQENIYGLNGEGRTAAEEKAHQQSIDRYSQQYGRARGQRIANDNRRAFTLNEIARQYTERVSDQDRSQTQGRRSAALSTVLAGGTSNSADLFRARQGIVGLNEAIGTNNGRLANALLDRQTATEDTRLGQTRLNEARDRSDKLQNNGWASTAQKQQALDDVNRLAQAQQQAVERQKQASIEVAKIRVEGARQELALTRESQATVQRMIRDEQNKGQSALERLGQMSKDERTKAASIGKALREGDYSALDKFSKSEIDSVRGLSNDLDQRLQTYYQSKTLDKEGKVSGELSPFFAGDEERRKALKAAEEDANQEEAEARKNLREKEVGAAEAEFGAEIRENLEVIKNAFIEAMRTEVKNMAASMAATQGGGV